MAWETRRGRGRYYTRSRRVGGRIEREYVGTGEGAELMAALDAAERADRLGARSAERAFERQWAALDKELALVDDLAEVMARVALLATGHHRHNGGEWRKRRGQA